MLQHFALSCSLTQLTESLKFLHINHVNIFSFSLPPHIGFNHHRYTTHNVWVRGGGGASVVSQRVPWSSNFDILIRFEHLEVRLIDDKSMRIRFFWLLSSSTHHSTCIIERTSHIYYKLFFCFSTLRLIGRVVPCAHCEVNVCAVCMQTMRNFLTRHIAHLIIVVDMSNFN